MTPDKCPFDEALKHIKDCLEYAKTQCGTWPAHCEEALLTARKATALIAARDEGKDKGEKI